MLLTVLHRSPRLGWRERDPRRRRCSVTSSGTEKGLRETRSPVVKTLGMFHEPRFGVPVSPERSPLPVCRDSGTSVRPGWEDCTKGNPLFLKDRGSSENETFEFTRSLVGKSVNESLKERSRRRTRVGADLKGVDSLVSTVVHRHRGLPSFPGDPSDVRETGVRVRPVQTSPSSRVRGREGPRVVKCGATVGVEFHVRGSVRCVGKSNLRDGGEPHVPNQRTVGTQGGGSPGKYPTPLKTKETTKRVLDLQDQYDDTMFGGVLTRVFCR